MTLPVSHLISDVWSMGYHTPGDPRAVGSKRLYSTMCGRRLPGQGHNWVMTFNSFDADCEDCLAALALKCLSEVP